MSPIAQGSHREVEVGVSGGKMWLPDVRVPQHTWMARDGEISWSEETVRGIDLISLDLSIPETIYFYASWYYDKT